MPFQDYINAQRANLDSPLQFELFATTCPLMDKLYEASVAAMPADSPLLEAIRLGLKASERALLLSIKAANPRWESMELPGVETLPAIRWKLANIKKMSPDKGGAAYGRLQKILEK